MTKKELIKRIEEFKPKYIYQRYDGRIHKYEVVNDNYLVETKTGMSFDFRSHLMLGKVSEKLKDLIEVGDYVNGEIVIDIGERGLYLGYADDDENYSRISIDESEIKSILTKEQFNSISYKVTKM